MPDVNINAGVTESHRFEEQPGDVATPAAGYFKDYFKVGGYYWIDDAGVVAGPIGAGFEPGGRLTLTTATPVTTADVTAAATLYYTPYKHNMISVYDGARWIPKTFAELSLSLVGYTASKPYDIFAYLNSGAVALESLIWTDGTTRATALAYQDGRLVKSGATTRLYLGTIYINSSGAQTDDSLLKRFVWNYYNRIRRTLYKSEATSHNWTTGSWRSWNNDATVRWEFIIGVDEDPITLSLNSAIETSYASIGLDVTNAPTLPTVSGQNLNGSLIFTGSSGSKLAGIGYHYCQAIEYGAAGATESEVYIGGVILA